MEPGLVIASAEGKQFLPRNTKMGSRGQSGRSGSGFAEAGECRAAKPDDGLSTARSGCATCKADNARMHEVGATKFRALNIIPLA